MKIYPETNSYNCFGCGRSGDVIEFCSLKEGSKHQGILKAAELCGLTQPEGYPAEKATQLKEDHVETINKVFSPSEADVARAVKVLAAYETAKIDGRGAAAVNGRMIDGATVRLARQVKAQAEYLGMIEASDEK